MENAKKVWIVWEANTLVPKVFESEARAHEYRSMRTRAVRHPVYIQPGEVDPYL